MTIVQKEDAVPVNAMGASSSVAGTGPIDTFDPLLTKKVMKRGPKPLRSILKGSK